MSIFALRIALFAGIFLSFYLTLGWIALFDLDEGAFSEATREMLKSGDYITTYLNGELRFDKPILIYWFQALSTKIFGLNEFAVRFPSAVAATLWVYVLYRFVKRYADEKRALLGAFMMSVLLQITIIAKASIADALLNLFIALTLFNIYLYYENRERKFIYLTYLFMGLGVLTKGPIAVLIPFVVSGIFFLSKREFGAWWSALLNPIGIVIFLAVTLPWYLAEYHAQGQKFIEGFFLKHNVERFKGPMEGHYGSMFYYIPVLIIGLLPFSTIYLRALFDALKKRLKDDLTLYAVIWFGFVFLFFSLSGTKLPHYVIYGYTGLFVLTALRGEVIERSGNFYIAPLVLYILLLVLPLYLQFGGVEQIRDAYAKVIVRESLGLFDRRYFLGLIGAILGTLLVGMSKREIYFKIVVIGLLFSGVINLIILPVVAQAKQTPIKEAALKARELQCKIVMEHINVPSFSFYARKIVKRRDAKAGECALIKSNRLKYFKKYETIYSKRGVVLIKVIER